MEKIKFKIGEFYSKLLKLLPDKVRNHIDYRIYIAKHQPILTIVFFASAIASLYQIVDLIFENSIFQITHTKLISNAKFWMLISPIIVTIIIKIIGIIKGYQIFRIEKRVLNMIDKNDYEILKVSKFEEEEHQKETDKIEGIEIEKDCYYSETLNIALQNTEKCEFVFFKSKRKKVKKYIKSHFNFLKVFLDYQYMISKKHDKIFHNETKICLSRDFDKELKKVYYHHLGYFDTYLTNLTAGKTLEDGITGKKLSSMDTFIKSDKLTGISADDYNNEIGISTIGITEDNYIVFWIQNSRALSSENLIVPTGSGSCDYYDDIDNDFIRTIKNAMERELLEESLTKFDKKGRSKYIEGTLLLGYFRWIKKAGKPEFVGITKLKLSYVELESNNKEVRKSKELEPEEFTNLDDLKKILIKQIKNKRTSIPLRYNIKVLLKYIKDNPEKIREFLKIG